MTARRPAAAASSPRALAHEAAAAAADASSAAAGAMKSSVLSAAAASSLAAPSLPLLLLPRAPRSALHASAEVYGFCLYVSTFVLAALYLCWALLPERVLHAWGVTYYPSHWWALALPAWGCSALALLPLLYFLVNMRFTLPLDHPALLRDSWTHQQRQQRQQGKVCHTDAAATAAAGARQQDARARLAPRARYSIPDVVDLPLARINELLYAQQPRAQGQRHRE